MIGVTKARDGSVLRRTASLQIGCNSALFGLPIPGGMAPSDQLSLVLLTSQTRLQKKESRRHSLGKEVA